jgi:hypothetical protein
MKLRRRDSYLSLDEEQGEDGLTFSELLPDSTPSPKEVCSVAEGRDQLVEVDHQWQASHRALGFDCSAPLWDLATLDNCRFCL